MCEEVLQGETVVERDVGGALEDEADLSVMARSYSSFWNSDLNMNMKRHQYRPAGHILTSDNL